MSIEWKRVSLATVLRQRRPDVSVDAGTTYDFAGVYSFGRGVFRGQSRPGSDFSYKLLTRLRRDEFVYPKLMAWEGAFGVVPDECHDCVVSPEFPVFEIDANAILPRFLDLYFRVPSLWEVVSGGSTGTNARRRRLYPRDLLRCSLLVPPLTVQRGIVARVDNVLRAAQDANALRSEVENKLTGLLLGAYRRISEGAPRRPLGEVAPLTRRPVLVKQRQSYPQIAVRSFGRGTFQKPALEGSDVTWEKPFRVEVGDLLISNIKAWEGAIAIVSDADHGRFASHRYLTCVADPEVANARYLCFHLLTAEGLQQVGEASPGSADRNRTLGAKALQAIPVPVPPIQRQRWFQRVFDEVDHARRLRSEAAAQQDGLLPAVLQRLLAPGLKGGVARPRAGQLTASRPGDLAELRPPGAHPLSGHRGRGPAQAVR